MGAGIVLAQPVQQHEGERQAVGIDASLSCPTHDDVARLIEGELRDTRQAEQLVFRRVVIGQERVFRADQIGPVGRHVLFAFRSAELPGGDGLRSTGRNGHVAQQRRRQCHCRKPSRAHHASAPADAGSRERMSAAYAPEGVTLRYLFILQRP